MKKFTKNDKQILHKLVEEYGEDVIATATTVVNDKSADYREFVFLYIRLLEGIRIRLREFHWETRNNSKHKLTDDMIAYYESKEDEIAEDLMGSLNYRIQVGDVVAIMPDSTELDKLIDEIDAISKEVKEFLDDNTKAYGLINIMDDLLHQTAKFKYLSTMK